MSLLTSTIKKKLIRELLQISDPVEYAQRLAESKELTKVEKIRLTGVWRQRYNINQSELTTARNRTGYYRVLKIRNAGERSRDYFDRYDYSDERRRWDDEKIRKFMTMNSDSSARIIARELRVSVPSVQAMRRKLALIGECEAGMKMQLMRKGEKYLRVRGPFQNN